MLVPIASRFSLLRIVTTQSRLFQSRLVVPRYFSTSFIPFKESIADSTVSKTVKSKANRTPTKKSSATKKKSTSASSSSKTKVKAKSKAKAKAKPSTKTAAKKVKVLTKTELKKKERPKKPLNNFSLYYKENFDKFYTPGEKVQLAVEKASKAWKELPDSVKAEYTARTEDSRKEYLKLREEWAAKYKRPLTGYTKFIKLNIDKSRCSSVEDAKIQVKELASKWSTFTPEEKNSWKAKEL